MSSLTFTRAPPLAPPPTLFVHPDSDEDLKSPAHPNSEPASPLAVPTAFPLNATARNSHTVPAGSTPRAFAFPPRETGGTPFNTPVPPRGRQLDLASRPTEKDLGSDSGIAAISSSLGSAPSVLAPRVATHTADKAPQGKTGKSAPAGPTGDVGIADGDSTTARPFASGPGAAGIIPSSLSTPLGGVRPINPISAMRGRGIGIGSRIPPIGEHHGAGTKEESGQSKGEAPHAFTPGNTPSSLERISRRMASNLLMVSNNGHKGELGGMNKIAPSYERRFTAGLHDLDHRLQVHAHAHAESGLRSPPQTMSASVSRNKAPFLGDKAAVSKVDWPSDFGDVSDSDERS